jgi:hypothetical protein
LPLLWVFVVILIDDSHKDGFNKKKKNNKRWKDVEKLQCAYIVIGVKWHCTYENSWVVSQKFKDRIAT